MADINLKKSESDTFLCYHKEPIKNGIDIVCKNRYYTDQIITCFMFKETN